MNHTAITIRFMTNTTNIKITIEIKGRGLYLHQKLYALLWWVTQWYFECRVAVFPAVVYGASNASRPMAYQKYTANGYLLLCPSWLGGNWPSTIVSHFSTRKHYRWNKKTMPLIDCKQLHNSPWKETPTRIQLLLVVYLVFIFIIKLYSYVLPCSMYIHGHIFYYPPLNMGGGCIMMYSITKNIKIH